ncbi:hypothetical protein [Sphingomonas sp. Ant20]|uniref:hypothetical protein n=1 Tax=Sphingomonas sp. Ant20 TaxID=104605 RepID=UPI0018E2FB0B|nr:hypothetical protein [Sphingomonas sp. Ant20]
MTVSPYPASFMENGYLFGAALFTMVLISMFSAMLLPLFAKQLWKDRRDGFTPANAFCATFTAICIGMIVLCSPEAFWMINYADMSVANRTITMNIIRCLDFLVLVPVGIWMTILICYRNEILLRLKAPTVRIWNDYRFTPLLRVLPLAGLCFAFALFITLGRAFH